MTGEDDLELAMEIMEEFSRSTGLSPPMDRPDRYLWTDAFAVCNFLELFSRTSRERYLDLAVALIEQVHQVLGRHRSDDTRKGWISGLSEKEGNLHPTAGGLRIGKGRRERRPDERPNEDLEWESDGQYFHYLTKWMHALNCAGRTTNEGKYIEWGMELARKAASAFSYRTEGVRRMHWKMSIDLGRPLVWSMGQHDALDGLLTFSELQMSSKEVVSHYNLDLLREITEMKGMALVGDLVTGDPLGIGSLLSDSWRAAQLIDGGFRYEGLMENVIDATVRSMDYAMRDRSFEGSANERLAFRELGLAIGLKGLDKMANWRGPGEKYFEQPVNLHDLIEQGDEYRLLGRGIEDFWTQRDHWEADPWREHRMINMVMLATCKAPGRFLSVASNDK